VKYGYDEITQGVRLNDAMSDTIEIDQLFRQLEVDPEALERVAMARAEMATVRFPPRASRMILTAAFGACFLDGFTACLHMFEQSLTDPDSDATL
jgi:hypothetical protein